MRLVICGEKGIIEPFSPLCILPGLAPQWPHTIVVPKNWPPAYTFKFTWEIGPFIWLEKWLVMLVRCYFSWLLYGNSRIKKYSEKSTRFMTRSSQKAYMPWAHFSYLCRLLGAFFFLLLLCICFSLKISHVVLVSETRNIWT